MSFAHYIALGDSVSIDMYPALDAGETDVAVALERVPVAGRVAPLGAASLLYRNSHDHWPEDAADDLISRWPEISFQNIAQDGATVGDVFGEQLPLLEESDEPTLVTLTAGLNDLLSAFSNKPRPGLLARIAGDVAEAYEFLVDSIRRARPNGLLVLSTVYDPSDATGQIPGVLERVGALPIATIEGLNTSIRRLAEGTPGTRVADLHSRFMGHGVTAPEDERWYWRRYLVEPNARGANEIRHSWWEQVTEDASNSMI